jgi:hypothetical protein
VTQDVDVVAHLGDCFDATYRGLGELAPLMSNDAFVVVTHEMSRSFGEVALSMREYMNQPLVPLPVISALLARSNTLDPSGTLTLYAVAMVLGPRLLVSLRDALEIVSEPRARAIFDEGQLVTVRQVRRVGELVAEPGIDETSWLAGVRELGDMVEFGQNAESFGLFR